MEDQIHRLMMVVVLRLRRSVNDLIGSEEQRLHQKPNVRRQFKNMVIESTYASLYLEISRWKKKKIMMIILMTIMLMRKGCLKSP